MLFIKTKKLLSVPATYLLILVSSVAIAETRQVDVKLIMETVAPSGTPWEKSEGKYSDNIKVRTI